MQGYRIRNRVLYIRQQFIKTRIEGGFHNEHFKKLEKVGGDADRGNDADRQLYSPCNGARTWQQPS